MTDKIASHAPLAFQVRPFCQRIGISPSTAWKFIKLGKIKVIRIGGRTLIPGAEVARILSQGLT